MAARKLCRETKLPSQTLLYFMGEEKTGIAPTRRILDKDRVAVGNVVYINWQGKKVRAEILALNGE